MEGKDREGLYPPYFSQTTMAMVSIVCSYILLFPSMVYLLLRHAQIEIVADVHMQYKANKLFNSSKNQWRTKCRG